jgi:DNA-binding winged helix-turn-helix (wHTH) protein/TolB-like protein/tetratricopeptide (TPR) repeat protein
MLYAFGQHRIDTTQRLLLFDGEIVPLPPKVFDLLLILVESRGQVVPKEDLLSRVWPDTFVEEANLAKGVHLLRKILGPDVIETFPKHGYRLVAPISEMHDDPGIEERGQKHHFLSKSRGHESGSAIPRTFAMMCTAALVLMGIAIGAIEIREVRPRIHSIAVLPFQTPDADHLLAVGFAQELAARLFTFQRLRVIFADFSTDPRKVAERSPIQAVLTGAFHSSGNGFRVSAQLLNARDGLVLWAEQIDCRQTPDLLSTQQMLAASIAARLRGRLSSTARVSLERRGSTSAEAYAAFLQGRAEAGRIREDSVSGTPSQACRYFERAVQLDAGFADAWAWLAFCEHMEVYLGRASGARHEAALEHAQRALSIDPENLAARRALAYIYSSTGYSEQALREAKSAIDINPEDPDATLAAARSYFRASMLDRAMDLYERYLASHPDDDGVRNDLVTACVFADAYERGIRAATPALAVQRLLYPTDLLYANSGDFRDAIALARKSIASPSASIVALYFGPLVLKSAGLGDEAQQSWVRAADHMAVQLSRNDNERTHMWLAMTYAQLGRAEDARDQIRRALALNHGGDPWNHFFASEAYALLGDRTMAIESLRQCVSRGFLGLHYLSYYQKPLYGWNRYRSDPEFRSIYAGLAKKVADLRRRF